MPWFSKKSEPVIRDDMGLEDLLHEARIARDPRFAYRCLQRAEVMAPDSLAVQRALLMHGRLHERSAKTLDYSVVKCYLWHGFEHPEKHTQEEQQRMARELFDDKRLQLCLGLSAEPEAFLRQYLEELAQEYLRLFVAGDASHVPKLFGLHPRGQLHKYLARPAADIIRNALSSPYLNAQEQLMAARAFYKAYYRQLEGESKELDRLLGSEICAALA